MTIFALVEGHPNVDVIILYVLASATLAVTPGYLARGGGYGRPSSMGPVGRKDPMILS